MSHAKVEELCLIDAAMEVLAFVGSGKTWSCVAVQTNESTSAHMDVTLPVLSIENGDVCACAKVAAASSAAPAERGEMDGFMM